MSAWAGPLWKSKETIQRGKNRKKRKEAAVKKSVREQCVARDGYCKPAKDGFKHECEGPSEWMHLPGFTRAQTRGMEPERRHSRKTSCMGCRRIHEMLDGKRHPRVVPEMGPDGADGKIQWRSK